MKFSKIAKALELRHYKKILLFMFRHPILFAERLSMFIKISIAWTVISTLFGFFLFGLVTRELVIEKGINKDLSYEMAQIRDELSNLKKTSSMDSKKLEVVINKIGDLYEIIYSSRLSASNKSAYKQRLSVVLRYLSNQNIALANTELEKLSKEVGKNY